VTFNHAAVATLFDKVVSHALTLAVFERVNSHEPKSPPGSGTSCAVWVQSIAPVTGSGLAATSGVVTLNVRLYSSFIQQPLDEIDPDLLTAATTLLGAYTGDFDFGGTVRNVDLLGMYGTPMSAQAGYLTQDSHVYRVMTITLHVVINDLWNQVA